MQRTPSKETTTKHKTTAGLLGRELRVSESFDQARELREQSERKVIRMFRVVGIPVRQWLRGELRSRHSGVGHIVVDPQIGPAIDGSYLQ